MKQKIVPLGLNGYIPTHGRQTTSFLFLTEANAILLDAGTGAARLGEPGVQEHLQPYSHLDVVLSHYHLDHVVGLFYLSGVWPGSVRIYAPAPPLVDATPTLALGRLLSPPLCPTDLEQLLPGVDVIVVTQESFSLGGLPVRAWSQSHPGGSVGYRFGDSLVYMTDRSMDLGQAAHARGARVLLHELWMTDEEAAAEPEKRVAHSHLSAVAEFANTAGVGALMPMHHHPSRTPQDVERICETLQKRVNMPVLRGQEAVPRIIA